MKKMAIRAYRRPIQLPAHIAMQPEDNVHLDGETAYIDIFVIMDAPLLELTHKDLVMLKEMKIDPFIEVE
jgi:hypothetical protein